MEETTKKRSLEILVDEMVNDSVLCSCKLSLKYALDANVKDNFHLIIANFHFTINYIYQSSLY